jgi:hypothetical protein
MNDRLRQMRFWWLNLKSWTVRVGAAFTGVIKKWDGSCLSVGEKNWTKELDMYPDFVGAIRDGNYKETKCILVVDTSQRNYFHAGVSVVNYDDAMVVKHLQCCIANIFGGTDSSARSRIPRTVYFTGCSL